MDACGASGDEPPLRRLRAEYKLDGTHLHPRYLSLLERAVGVAAGDDEAASLGYFDAPLV